MRSFFYSSFKITRLIVFLRRDLRLKEQEATKANTTAGGMTERRKLLAASIREFWTVQKIYMPGLSHLLEEAGNDARIQTHPELFKLMVPSQLSADVCETWCLPGLPTLEAHFRYAQADDALAEIRRLRRLFQGLSDQNKKHITNTQHTLTRAKGTFERYKARISRFAVVYRHARRALIVLDPKGEITQWTPRFLELKETDIRGPGREEDERSEGRIKPSWIWNILLSRESPNTYRSDTSHPNTSHPNTSLPDASHTDAPRPTADPDSSGSLDLSSRASRGEEIAVSIRAHWARCQARAERHEEEVQLTVEEMRRTLDFFKWKSRWWLSLQNLRADSAVPLDPQTHYGLRAYANRQARMYSLLVTTYVNHWRKFLVEHSLGLDWLSLYPEVSPPATVPIPVEVMDKPLGGEEDEDELAFEDPTDQAFEEKFAELHGNQLL